MPRLSTLGLLALGASLTAGVQVRDLDGTPRRPFDPDGAATVLVFVASDCPVSNGYAPEIQRECEAFAGRHVSCLLVYEDVGITSAAVRTHLREYRYRNLPAVIDADGALASRAKVTVTPAVAVVAPGGAIRYRGRIDDRYIATGKPREVVTSHDLSDAVEALLAGKAIPRPETEAFGCYIPTIRRSARRPS